MNPNMHTEHTETRVDFDQQIEPNSATNGSLRPSFLQFRLFTHSMENPATQDANPMAAGFTDTEVSLGMESGGYAEQLDAYSPPPLTSSSEDSLPFLLPPNPASRAPVDQPADFVNFNGTVSEDFRQVPAPLQVDPGVSPQLSHQVQPLQTPSYQPSSSPPVIEAAPATSAPPPVVRVTPNELRQCKKRKNKTDQPVDASDENLHTTTQMPPKTPKNTRLNQRNLNIFIQLANELDVYGQTYGKVTPTWDKFRARLKDEHDIRVSPNTLQSTLDDAITYHLVSPFSLHYIMSALFYLRRDVTDTLDAPGTPAIISGHAEAHGK